MALQIPDLSQTRQRSNTVSHLGNHSDSSTFKSDLGQSQQVRRPSYDSPRFNQQQQQQQQNQQYGIGNNQKQYLHPGSLGVNTSGLRPSSGQLSAPLMSYGAPNHADSMRPPSPGLGSTSGGDSRPHSPLASPSSEVFPTPQQNNNLLSPHIHHRGLSKTLRIPQHPLTVPPKRASSLFSRRDRDQSEDNVSLYDKGDGAYPPRPPPSDDDDESVERDEYGFMRSTQWLTIDDFHEFDKFYKPIQERRSQKWAQLVKEDGHGHLPVRSTKLKRYIRKGIPSNMRGAAWFHYSGAEEKMAKNAGVYQSILERAEAESQTNEYVEIIERDLHRTFPENIRFKSTTNNPDGSITLDPNHVPAIQSLRRVLITFSVFSPKIGYCQSLNYIAGLLLLFMKEEEAFWTLVTIVHDYLPAGMYDVTMEGANIDQTVLMMFLSEKVPTVWAKISGGKTVTELESSGGAGGMPTVTLVTSNWFLTLFINILPIETVLRVWDCFFYEGPKILFRVALTIFKMNENKILSVHDPLEVFQIVQNMPKRMIDCHRLMEICFKRLNSTTDISRKDIDRRRAEFRERRKQRRISVKVPQSPLGFGTGLRKLSRSKPSLPFTK